MKEEVLKPVERVEDLNDREEVEIIIKHRVFTEDDYEEIRRILEGFVRPNNDNGY